MARHPLPPGQALWRDKHLPFQVQFFHPGLYYDRTVRDERRRRATASIRCRSRPSQFDYGKNDFASQVPQDLGYAGFRIHTPIKTPKYYDEVIVFLGASYFRAVGKRRGLRRSRRAGWRSTPREPSGEEFPYFTRVLAGARRRPDAKDVTVYALLDSPSVTGAYRFVIQPGEQTTVDVEARLFPRSEVDEARHRAAHQHVLPRREHARGTFDDFRPEVHDSDGLLIAHRHRRVAVAAARQPAHAARQRLPDCTNPKGFGLIQRDRDFDHYQDLETRPELRPSIWVEPHGDWGDGPRRAGRDPDQDGHQRQHRRLLGAGRRCRSPASRSPSPTRMYWYGDDPTRPPGGRVVATRRDRGTVRGRVPLRHRLRRQEARRAPRRHGAARRRHASRGGDDAAELLDQHVVKNPVTGGWRLTFQVRPKTDKPLELRAFLDKGGDTLTETWSYGVLP